MLMSMNAIGRLTQAKPGMKEKTVFDDKYTNLLEKPLVNAKRKRSFKEIGERNEYISNGKSTAKHGVPSKIKKMESTTIRNFKKTEKNRLVVTTTGIHPTLKMAKDEISRLGINLRKVEEQSTFWRQKTLNLQKQLRSSKKCAAQLSEKVVKLEVERVGLQKKVNAAEKLSNTILDTMTNLITENKELKETIGHIDIELKTLKEEDVKADNQAEDNSRNSIVLAKALEDTMADLHDRLTEIEELKKLVARVTIEKSLLEKEIAKKHIISEIVDINNEEDDEKDGKNKITKLQNAVEKCMFRIAVLSQKNEELRKMNADSLVNLNEDASMIELQEEDYKLSVLESTCMKRYRKLLKMAAEELVTQEARSFK